MTARPDPWSVLPPVQVSWRGRWAYRDALDAQRAHREALLDGEARPEVLWLLEHEPVVTTGLRAVPDLPEPSFFRDRGVAVHRTERGGLATYHGPGQLVGYLIIHLRRRRLGVRRTMHALEQALVEWLDGRGVAAGRRGGHPGVWVGPDKIAAVGLHVRKGVSLHGFALNLDPDLAPFGWFTPCGVTDGGVTSLAALTGWAPAPREVAQELGDRVLWALWQESVDSRAGRR